MPFEVSKRVCQNYGPHVIAIRCLDGRSVPAVTRGGVTIKALAEHVASPPTHVTTEIGRLEAKGLLVKKSNESDRQGVLVSLTKKVNKASNALHDRQNRE